MITPVAIPTPPIMWSLELKTSSMASGQLWKYKTISWLLISLCKFNTVKLMPFICWKTDSQFNLYRSLWKYNISFHFVNALKDQLFSVSWTAFFTTLRWTLTRLLLREICVFHWIIQVELNVEPRVTNTSSALKLIWSDLV